MKQGNYVLLAWAQYEAGGGLNDCSGWFESVKAALEFFNTSEHCKYCDNYQIINTKTWEVEMEGNN